MRLGLVAAIVLVLISSAIAISLKLQNSKQEKHTRELESQLQTTTDNLQQKNDVLKADLANKITLIETMRKQLPGAAPLPAELISMLESWARGNELVTFEPNRSAVKFKSSLFAGGSAEVEPAGAEMLKSLCKILNTEQAKEFDIIIAGHTDNQPILNPATLAKHPSNLHLSVHRAISVFNVMTNNGIIPERVSVRGFGEYRPIVPNEPNMVGTPQNRRVEIYIVPRGI
ncbi:MAG: OmpA family protein [Phycisphaerae bacterium]|nr:OmpA family protein [Phycisphaerae bacterium]MDD5380981.1 OmpA family protein [Phycisphaerae bacterium]